jgi:hypothetical protein
MDPFRLYFILITEADLDPTVSRFREILLPLLMKFFSFH